MNKNSNISYGIDLPPLDEQVVKALNRKFPERCPDPFDSERELWMKAGERRVVRYLLDQWERQKEVDKALGFPFQHIGGVR